MKPRLVEQHNLQLVAFYWRYTDFLNYCFSLNDISRGCSTVIRGGSSLPGYSRLKKESISFLLFSLFKSTHPKGKPSSCYIGKLITLSNIMIQNSEKRKSQTHSHLEILCRTEYRTSTLHSNTLA